MIKICYKCKNTKSLEDFNKCFKAKDGYQSACRQCETEYRIANKSKIQERRDNYRLRKKEWLKERSRLWRLNNPEMVKKMAQEYRLKNKEQERTQKQKYYVENKEKIDTYRKQWNAKNKEYMRKWRRNYAREQRKNNPQFVIRHRLTARLREMVTKGAKSSSTLALLGCSIEDFKKHLESQFTKGMTWECFMSSKIHIDHIRPCCSFDLTDPEQQKQCFHWSNMRPMWERENKQKLSEDLKMAKKMKKNSVSNN